MSEPKLDLSAAAILPVDAAEAVLVGRVWRPGIGPSVVTLRDGVLFDVTAKAAPTVRDLFELDHPLDHLKKVAGEAIGPVEAVLANSDEEARDAASPYFLAPIDLQAVKAAGVTFVISLLERVIEEQARGAPERAVEIRGALGSIIGHDLSKLRPGSPEAMEIKRMLIAKGAWSQYLEVGIGPDPEIFTKGQPLSQVGVGASVGILPISTWNNPEPEIVVVANSRGTIVGAMLGNDVNLRDVEGRSALLLGKAKDNNASATLGPFVRFFDASFSLDELRRAELTLVVEGPEGYRLQGSSSLSKISRDFADLAKQMLGRHHQYPDGAVLYTGTLFAPIEDRDAPGKGFTHKVGDIVSIATPKLGRLVNRIRLATECAPWTFGTSHLMRNLARRRLI